MRKILSRLTSTAVIVLAIVYFLAGTTVIRIRAGGSASVRSVQTEESVLLTEDTDVDALTEKFTSLRWRLILGRTDTGTPLWQIRWIDDGDTPTKEITVYDSGVIRYDGRYWKPFFGEHFSVRSVSDVFSRP